MDSAQGNDLPLASIFGDVSQSEKLSEITPPLQLRLHHETWHQSKSLHLGASANFEFT